MMIKDNLTHSMEWRLEEFKNENIDMLSSLVFLEKTPAQLTQPALSSSRNTFSKWTLLWNTLQALPSALLKPSNPFTNLEFHSRLLQKLPSAISAI
jgi:hypothetical protein